MPFMYLVVTIVVVGICAWLVNVRMPVPQAVRGIANVMMGLVAIGIVLWLINNYVPMAQSIKDLLNVVVFIASLVWVLQAFGLWPRVVAIWGRMVTRITSPSRDSEPVRHP